MRTFPRETSEFLPLTVTLDGDPVTDYEVALAPYGDRPEAWEMAMDLDDAKGVMIDALAPGYWSVWARVTDNPEVPVMLVDTIAIT